MRRTWVVGASVCALILISATAALAFKPKAGSWTGTTSQSEPLTFHVSRNGLTIMNFEPEFVGMCTLSGSPTKTSNPIITDAGRNISIKKNKFHARATNGRIHTNTMTLATASDQVHGKFVSKHKAKGTYSVTFKFNGNAAQYGLANYTCKTGTVSWTATAS
jgi:hypothetical protein